MHFTNVRDCLKSSKITIIFMSVKKQVAILCRLQERRGNQSVASGINFSYVSNVLIIPLFFIKRFISEASIAD